MTSGRERALTYSEYLRVPELLSQQRCLASPEVHDELQFIVVHQVYELWFKLVLHTLDEMQRLVTAGDEVSLRGAVRLGRRIESIFRVLIQQIHVLETMRPADFLKFRSLLNPASGFGSLQFREVECAFGLKDSQLAAAASSDPRYAELERRMVAPSLCDVFYERLAALGLAVVAPGPQRTDDERRRTLASLRTLYDEPDEHPLEYDLCETFIELDEQLVLWRRHHIMMVERHIGDKPGTGKGVTGDLDGIRYLTTTLTRRAFPDLWAVRTVLTD
ncbi:MAG: tryptophan 2,3-dioxygenase [Planctomycetes bacterium]|nr:tryptophan 2,3-dioxygenase [Planctomycetota bacterium]